MTLDIPFVAAQVAPVPWDMAATLSAYETYVCGIAKTLPATRLIVHPELHLAAYGSFSSAIPSDWTPASAAVSIPGPLTDRLTELASDLSVWLFPGSVFEISNGTIYNTAIAIGPDGTMRASYRKLFPWRPFETSSAGDRFSVLDLDGIGRVGLLVCYDGWFPEVARQLAWMGAEVLIHPSATDTVDREQELVLAQANAIANQVAVVNVNAGLGTGIGKSIIVDPEGHVVYQAGTATESITGVIDFDHVRRVRERGTAGLNRMWDQLDKEGRHIALTMYGGTILPRPGASDTSDP